MGQGSKPEAPDVGPEPESMRTQGPKQCRCGCNAAARAPGPIGPGSFRVRAHTRWKYCASPGCQFSSSPGASSLVHQYQLSYGGGLAVPKYTLVLKDPYFIRLGADDSVVFSKGSVNMDPPFRANITNTRDYHSETCHPEFSYGFHMESLGEGHQLREVHQIQSIFAFQPV